jgi:hypothetical protein
MNKTLARYMSHIPDGVLMHDSWAALIAYGFGHVGIVEKPMLKYRRHQENITYSFERNALVRIKHFFTTTYTHSKRKDYLKAELRQGELFYEFYNTYLDESKKSTLKNFLMLKEKNFTIRKINSMLSKH